MQEWADTYREKGKHLPVSQLKEHKSTLENTLNVGFVDTPHSSKAAEKYQKLATGFSKALLSHIDKRVADSIIRELVDKIMTPLDLEHGGWSEKGKLHLKQIDSFLVEQLKKISQQSNGQVLELTKDQQDAIRGSIQLCTVLVNDERDLNLKSAKEKVKQCLQSQLQDIRPLHHAP